MRRIILVGMLVMTGLFAAQANAKGIPVFWGSSEKVIKVYDLPRTDQYEVNKMHMDLGYKYNTFELFWIPLYAYNGETVGYINDTIYVDLTPDQLDYITTENNIVDVLNKSQYPFWDQWAGLTMVIILLLVVLPVVMVLKRKRNTSTNALPVAD